jgi:hypothetical protein
MSADSPSGVRRSVQQLILAWLLVLAIGGHWPLLQSVAWVNMLFSYTRTEGLVTAVSKTFDGEHPCDICLLVKKGKESEREQPQQISKLKIDLILVAVEPIVLRRLPTVATEPSHIEPILRMPPPDLPPPRV